MVIAINMIAYRSHSCIIHVTTIVPHTIFLANPHMAHLNRKEIFHYRLPHSPIKHIIGNTENRRLAFAITHEIHAITFDIAEVNSIILISQELAPLYRSNVSNLFFTFGSKLANRSHLCSLRAFIHFYNSLLCLTTKITHLRSLHNRFIHPSANNIRCYLPTNGSFGHTCRNIATKNKPTIIMVHPPIIEF